MVIARLYHVPLSKACWSGTPLPQLSDVSMELAPENQSLYPQEVPLVPINVAELEVNADSDSFGANHRKMLIPVLSGFRYNEEDGEDIITLTSSVFPLKLAGAKPAPGISARE